MDSQSIWFPNKCYHCIFKQGSLSVSFSSHSLNQGESSVLATEKKLHNKPYNHKLHFTPFFSIALFFFPSLCCTVRTLPCCCKKENLFLCPWPGFKAKVCSAVRNTAAALLAMLWPALIKVAVVAAPVVLGL